MTTPEDKGEGRGRGRFTAKGVQAQQEADLTTLKDIVTDLLERVEALEGEEVPA